MTALELLFLATSIIAWTLLLAAHRRHVRAMRAQSLACIRRASDAYMRGWFCGLKYKARKGALHEAAPPFTDQP